MKTYDLSQLTNKLVNIEVSLVNKNFLKSIFEITDQRNLFLIINKLVASGWLTKVERDKYKINNHPVHDFELANFLYQPSYISFESALNYWGILSQFPFETTSATLKLSRTKKNDNKIFSFIRLDKKYYFGFEKVDNFLIASPEKALFDQAYLWTKGLKQLNWDEYDLSRIKKAELKKLLTVLNLDKKLIIKK